MKNKIVIKVGTIASAFLIFIFTSVENVQLVYGQTGEGEKIYSEYCSGCHNGGFIGWISGAPETGDISEWAPFFKKGQDEMTASAIKGAGRMDPKGGCDTCSDEQIKSAVDYIVLKTSQ